MKLLVKISAFSKISGKACAKDITRSMEAVGSPLRYCKAVVSCRYIFMTLPLIQRPRRWTKSEDSVVCMSQVAPPALREPKSKGFIPL